MAPDGGGQLSVLLRRLGQDHVEPDGAGFGQRVEKAGVMESAGSAIGRASSETGSSMAAMTIVRSAGTRSAQPKREIIEGPIQASEHPQEFRSEEEDQAQTENGDLAGRFGNGADRPHRANK